MSHGCRNWRLAPARTLAGVPVPPEQPPSRMVSLKDQVGGDHYRSRVIQPIEYSMSNKLGLAEGSVVKYVTRHQDKGKAEDIRKAMQYLAFTLEYDYGIIATTTYKDQNS